MNKKIFLLSVLLAFMLHAFCELHAQVRTVGTLKNDSAAFKGYTLFAPIRSTKTYLINNEGRVVHSWLSNLQPGQAVYLLENGNLLHTASLPPPGNTVFRSGGAGGRVQEYDWDGKLLWEFEYSSNKYLSHHDAKKLPNGNVIMIAWEYKTYAEAIAVGRNPNKLPDNALWPDHIIEVKKTGATTGDIVWEWHVWDHLIQDNDPTKSNYGTVTDHPELVDINFTGGGANADWLHVNSIAYNSTFDQIIFSNHNFGEVWIIDHSTTTVEAANHKGGRSGKGGDLLYRWGNPQAYRAGNASDQKFFGQHDPQWIGKGLSGEGNILVFNNGLNRPQGRYSSVEEFTSPVDENGNYTYASGKAYEPKTQNWIYTASNPASFYSQNISGAQRLPNGNTLICNGANGIFFEVTSIKQTVWEYVNPVTAAGILTQGDSVPGGPQGRTNNVFKIQRYAPDYAAFIGRDVSPGDPIEKYVTAVHENTNDAVPSEITLYQNYPNPFSESTTIRFSLSRREMVRVRVYDLLGREVTTLIEKELSAGEHVVEYIQKNLTPGTYIYRLESPFAQVNKLCTIIK